MSLISGKARRAHGLALAGVLATIVSASAAGQALAGDDGAAPIWSGISGLMGLTNKPIRISIIGNARVSCCRRR